MRFLLALTVAFIFLKEHLVFGYLDPASGGGLIAFLVAIGVGFAFYGKKIFYKLRSKKDDSEEKTSDDEESKDE